jgi:hypothetical protein
VNLCGATSVTENEFPEILLYPNPTFDLLQLQAVSEDRIESIKLHSLTGQLLLTSTADNKQTAILDLSNFSTGIYVLEICTQRGMVVKRIEKR